ncbi:hypothetical protein HDU84_008104 [Entophlyctis sp. JEL0112]|nr:hypothetical protein HDU84_008104 [Entophlyctis sp. JEL0112]
MLDVGIDGVIGGFTGNTGGGSFSNASPLNYSFEGGAAVNGLLGDVSANPKKRKLLLGDSDTVDVISAGPAGMGPPAFVAQKRMPSIPSATAENILELLDDKIFELIQSPPFSDTIPIDEPLTQPAPVVSTPQDAMVGEPNFVVPRVGIAATQQRIHNAQEKANRIQEDIDKLDSHLVNTSSLLGIQDLDMDDFFGLNGAGIDENETDAGVSAVPDGVSAGTVLQLDGDRNDSLFGL